MSDVRPDTGGRTFGDPRFGLPALDPADGRNFFFEADAPELPAFLAIEARAFGRRFR